MIGRKWLVVGAALFGVVAASFVAPQVAHAKKKKPSISCKTDRVGKFKTNTQAEEPLAVTYTASTDALVVVGGFAKVQGAGIRTKATARSISLVATIPDLETRTDFPITVDVGETTFTHAVVAVVNPTAKVWIGDDLDVGHTMSITVTGIRDGKISATFGGSVPVDSGDSSPLTISKGKVYAPLTIQ